MRCLAIERTNGEVSVIHANQTRYTFDPNEDTEATGRTLIEDEAAFYAAEAAKDPTFPQGGPSVVMDVAALPARTNRRNAWRFNPAKDGVLDDQTVTTPLEARAAALWKQEQEIAAPGPPSGTTRKLAAGRFDLLDAGELDAIVSDWRASAGVPAESKFTPPADRKPIPPIDVVIRP